MIAKRDVLHASTWWRNETSPEILPQKSVDLIRRQIANAPLDEKVEGITVSVLQDLLTAHEKPETRPGAHIRDDERGVSYYVTINRHQGHSTLRTLEIVPDEGVTDQRVFRVPAATLLQLATEIVAEREAGRIVLRAHAAPDRQRVPGAVELAELVNEGWTRRKIAEVFDRDQSVVDQWLRRARKKLPNAFPKRTRGPKPKTPAANAAGDRKNGEQQ